MLHRKIKYGILLLLALLAAILAMIFFSVRSGGLRVVFIDVGQGDAILISKGSQQVLIDGGKDGKLLLEKLGKYIPFWDRNVESIIATHPDQDHIGGLVDVLKTYSVGTVIKTNAQSESQIFQKLEDEISSSGAQKVEAKKDVTITFPDGEIIKVLYPLVSLPQAVDNDSNANSVVLKLVSGDSSFIFTGDLLSEKEKVLVSDGADIRADVLKVGHHGSKYSTGDEFLSAINPIDAVISVGKNNSYGHPNQEVLQRLLQRRINILRTDEIGDIVYNCASPAIKCVRVAN